MTKKTTEYNKFKFLDSNRDIDPHRVDYLAKCIQENNLLEMYPILCDQDLNIYDGQHRFLAAQKLNIPFYYTINSKIQTKDLVHLNNQVSWKKQDFFKFYVQNQSPEYIKLSDFMRQQDLSFIQAYNLMNTYRDRKFSENFKMGKYVFSDKRASDLVTFLQVVRDCINFISRKMPEAKKYTGNLFFQSALVQFLNVSQVDVNVFMRKLELNLSMLRKCGSCSEYVRLFERIYNWKNRSPIEAIKKYSYDEEE